MTPSNRADLDGARGLAPLRRLGDLVGSEGPLVDRLGSAVELVASSLGADGCALGVLADGAIDVLATTGYRTEDVARWPNVGLGESVPLAEAVRQGELVAFASPDELVSVLGRGALDELSDRSWVAVPIVMRGLTVAVLGASWRAPHVLTGDEAAAATIASALLRPLVLEHLAAAEGAAGLVIRGADEQEVEARLAETAALLDTVLSAAPVGIAFLDQDLRVVRINGALAGYAARSPDEHHGRPLATAAPWLDALLGERLARVLATQEAEIDLELHASVDGGRSMDLVASVYPVQTLDDRVLGVGVVLFDVTRRNARQQRTERDLTAHIREQAGVLERLQTAILPPSLPEHPSFDIDARYESAADVVEIGGDWYDAFEAPDGRLLVTVGDAVGHGVPAIEVMALARTALRAFVAEGHGPASALDALHTLMRREDAMATCTVVAISPDRRIEYASAGHPWPYVRHRSGATRPLDLARGVPLGSLPGASFSAGHSALEPGDALVLYTDGLVERRGESLDVGFARLREALAEVSPANAEDLGRVLLDRCLAGVDRFDDVCVLTLVVGDAPGVGGREGAT